MRSASPLLALAALACACGNATGRTSAPPGALPLSYAPDVPRWRGGCFLAGPAGKIVNGSPGPEVLAFGSACADPAGPGGIVYLDRYDPITGGGDVTVLSAAAGAAPVVIAAGGGSGTSLPGRTGARFDAAQRRVLALANVSVVTGQLVVADLPDAATVTPIADGVRATNYEFLPDGSVLLVGNYDATTREGDLLHWDGSGTREVAHRASRFDFVMYRLDPARSRVAYLRGYGAAKGGDLYVQALPPTGESAEPLASGVLSMAWSDDARLVYWTLNDDGVTYAVWAWDGAGTPRQLAPSVNAASVSGPLVVIATGWSVLSQSAALQALPASGGPPVLDGLGPAALGYALSPAPPADVALAFAAVGPGVDVSTGELHVAFAGSPAPTRLDSGVSTAAGLAWSPAGGFVSYAVGWEAPQAAGSASPQPGLAQELRVVAAAGGPPLTIATQASRWVAWDGQDRWVAGLGAFSPAANTGDLFVRTATTGELALVERAVGAARYGFADDGSLVWALRGWNDALGEGELVVAPTSSEVDWTSVPVAARCTCVGLAARGRTVHCVRGGGRDGLWLGP